MNKPYLFPMPDGTYNEDNTVDVMMMASVSVPRIWLR